MNLWHFILRDCVCVCKYLWEPFQYNKMKKNIFYEKLFNLFTFPDAMKMNFMGCGHFNSNVLNSIESC